MKLPSLKPEEAWLDRFNESFDEPLSEKIKRLLYLPTIAYATSVYAHENKLAQAQKEYLLLLFRGEAEKAFSTIYTQIQITVGNSPSERIGYLREFENWQRRLSELLKKALGCIDKDTWLQKLEALTPDKNPLFYENRQEWENNLREWFSLGTKVFNKIEYFHKFSDFTYEAMKLLRRGSVMIEITMERREWIYQAMKNIGMLPAHGKIPERQNVSLVNNEAQIKVLKTIQSKLSEPIEELDVLIKNISSEKPEAMRDQVFICYSHKDKRWLEDLETHLKPYVRNGSIAAWSDKQIAPGSKWLKEIEVALALTKVAVLLVTPNFLASDFIHENELGPFLKKAERGKVTIIWIPVRACSYKETPLKDYQAAVDPEKPLANMKAERDKSWVKICEEIKKATR